LEIDAKVVVHLLSESAREVEILTPAQEGLFRQIRFVSEPRQPSRNRSTLRWSTSRLGGPALRSSMRSGRVSPERRLSTRNGASGRFS